MVMLQEHGLSYSTITTREQWWEMSPTVRRMVNAYIAMAGDKYTADEIMNMLDVAVGAKTVLIFVVMLDGFGVGLLTAHAVDHNDTQHGAMIHIGYVDPGVSHEESGQIIDKAMETLFEWAGENKWSSVFAQTNRAEKPFDKLLGKYGWKRITTVYEKEIDDGRHSESDGAVVGSGAAT